MTDRTTSDASPAAPSPGGSASRRGAPNPRRVVKHLPTGVPGLDAVLGGGLPEFSFNMLAGGPGAGKTTLAQQILFANATVERPAIYFTVLGEPTVKMLRYQQQFAFFQPAMAGTAVHYINLSAEVLSGDLGAVLARVTADVERLSPGLVVVDSFRSLRTGIEEALVEAAEARASGSGSTRMALEQFVQGLALHLTSWEVTSLLIGEYDEPEQRQPLFTIADGILWLTQAIDRNSVVRKLQVVKVRGQEQMPGLHTFRITDDGLQVFPRIPEQQRDRRKRPDGTHGQAEDRRHEPPGDEPRLSTGVPGLDALMGGGIPRGDAVMIAGPTGSGKSTFGMHFAADGLRNGEAVVVAAFEEYPEKYLERLRRFDIDPDAMIAANKLRVTYLRPLDLSVDETLDEILVSVRDTGATRVIIDSLTGFEVALAPTFREDFRESLYRLVGALTATRVTVFMVHEAVATSPSPSFTGERVSFITDDIIAQRYVELDGAMKRVLSVVKMRGSEHNDQFWRYQVSAAGAVIGAPLVGYRNILSGSAERDAGTPAAQPPIGLTEIEATVLAALVRSGETTLEALTVSVGNSRIEVTRAVERLVSLDYAVLAPGSAEDIQRYRAVARSAV
ncbi:MAG: AAA family ATPase [Gemmatimonadaceae bacterium]|nr:AAA family ATPase [Gemmatimonadaceae bacterium]